MEPVKRPKKRIAYCPKCHKQTAWMYVSGVETFWLCLICATREEAQMAQEPDPREIRVTR
jgi:hypothetical protein